MRTKVYKCSLLSITKDIEVYKDKSRKQNIEQADAVEVETLFVQPISNPKYMKEVISGKLIPVFRIQEITGSPLGKIVYSYPPSWPCYIKYIEEIEFEEYRGNTLVEATYEELEAYYDKFNGREDSTIMEDRLEELFLLGESYYQEASKKKSLSEEKLIKQLLKSRKK